MQIIVLGMHRSGTSLCTRLINLMGAYFGPESVALPASPDNPKGFWERKDILACNRDLLRISGCSWYSTHRWNHHTMPPLPAPLFAGMKNVIRELAGHTPFVMKDPRFCLTLPCWMPLLLSPIPVIVYRDPLEIAGSLARRNNMPADYALALWEHHSVHLIQNTHALPKVFVRYETLMRSPVEATRQILETLQKIGVPGLSMPSEEAILEFVEPALKRAIAVSGITLSEHQQEVAAMLRGEKPFDARLHVSPQAMQVLLTLSNKVSGAPASH